MKSPRLRVRFESEKIAMSEVDGESERRAALSKLKLGRRTRGRGRGGPILEGETVLEGETGWGRFGRGEDRSRKVEGFDGHLLELRSRDLGESAEGSLLRFRVVDVHPLRRRFRDVGVDGEGTNAEYILAGAGIGRVGGNEFGEKASLADLRLLPSRRSRHRLERNKIRAQSLTQVKESVHTRRRKK